MGVNRLFKEADDEALAVNQPLISEQTNSVNYIPSTGLTLEQMLKYERDLYWVRIRWLSLTLIAIGYLAMFSAIALMIAYSPTCPSRPKINFYQAEIFYQVEVSNFKDSNGDGIGDLVGLISKLDYIQSELGANIICLNRLISKETPTQIDPEYGNQPDLASLRKELDNRDMYLIIDMPISYLVANDSVSQFSFSQWLAKL